MTATDYLETLIGMEVAVGDPRAEEEPWTGRLLGFDSLGIVLEGAWPSRYFIPWSNLLHITSHGESEES